VLPKEGENHVAHLSVHQEGLQIADTPEAQTRIMRHYEATKQLMEHEKMMLVQATATSVENEADQYQMALQQEMAKQQPGGNVSQTGGNEELVRMLGNVGAGSF
jgi:hypothetical protein